VKGALKNSIFHKAVWGEIKMLGDLGGVCQLNHSTEKDKQN
jgi:hypothetical protein